MLLVTAESQDHKSTSKIEKKQANYAIDYLSYSYYTLTNDDIPLCTHTSNMISTLDSRYETEYNVYMWLSGMKQKMISTCDSMI